MAYIRGYLKLAAAVDREFRLFRLAARQHHQGSRYPCCWRLNTLTTVNLRPSPTTYAICQLATDCGGRVRSELCEPRSYIAESARIKQVCKAPMPSNFLNDHSGEAHFSVSM